MPLHSAAATLLLCFIAATPQQAEAPKPTNTPAAHRIPAIVFIPTPDDVVDHMLELAQPRRDDVLYDLGCGDGRIVVAAAKRYHCRAVGVDIDPRRIAQANRNVKRNHLQGQITIRQQDLFETDLRNATVVTLYLNTTANTKLVPQLNRMKPGSRVVSHQFKIQGTPPDRTVEVRSKKDGRVHTLYLWKTPIANTREGDRSEHPSTQRLDHRPNRQLAPVQHHGNREDHGED